MHERGGVKGAVEQDFDVILATMSAVVSDAIREAGQAPESVALTGQGDGCWITDEKFHPVRPALSWLDGRAGPLVDEWAKSGVLQQVYEICGGAMFPGAPAAVPEVARRERTADAGPRGHRGLLQGRALRPAHRRAGHRPVGRVACPSATAPAWATATACWS